MKVRLLTPTILIFILAAAAFAQGGKAEPNRIEFAKGKTSKTVTGKIYGDLQAEYIYSARKGQTVTVTISSTPKGKYAYFNAVNPNDYQDWKDEESEMYYYKYVVQEDENVVLLVRFKPSGKVKSARYALTLSIK